MLIFGRDLHDSAICRHVEYKLAYSLAFTIYSLWSNSYFTVSQLILLILELILIVI
jgi:hypothetical protein